MEATSFSSKLILSVLAKDDNASCPSPMNLSSTPMYRLCRACLSRSASAFSVARFDEQGNAKAFRMWNERQTGSTFFIVYTHAINNI